MKILYLNTQYFQYSDGRLLSRIVEGIFLILPKSRRLFPIHLFNKIINEVQPDIVCLVEVKKWQQKEILKHCKEYRHHDFENKYSPESIFRKLPFMRSRGNFIMSKEELPFRKVFLNNGSKKLLYEITIKHGTKLIVGHYSLSKTTRKKQFKEIAQMYKDEKSLILTGDFNIFNGIRELRYLKKALQLEDYDLGPSFPTFEANKKLDRVLHTKNIHISAKLLRDRVSDHLPILIELH